MAPKRRSLTVEFRKLVNRRFLIPVFILAVAALGWLEVRDFRDQAEKERAFSVISGLGGRIGSITPPVPFSGSEYHIEFQGTQFGPGDVRQLAVLKPLAERNVLGITFEDTNVTAADIRWLSEKMPKFGLHRVVKGEYVHDGLGLRIELNPPRESAEIEFRESFHVVLTNTSEKPVTLFRQSSREGYYQLTLHFRNSRSGAEYVAHKREIDDPDFFAALQSQRRAKAKFVRVRPHSEYRINLCLSDVAWGQPAWSGLPAPNSPEPFTIFAVFESKDASHGTAPVWVGRVQSPEVSARLVAERLKTPQDYLRNGFPEKALEMLRADPGWVARPDEDMATPLHVAAWYGHPEIVKWLLGKGADVNAIAYNGFTPLHLRRNPEVITLLLSKHPDLTIRDSSEETPLQRAASEFAGARIDAERRRWHDAVDAYLKAGAEEDLLTAVAIGDLPRVKVLLAASPEMADRFQEQSLLRKAARFGQLEIARFLIDKHHVDVNDFGRGYGYPILKSVLARPDFVRLLIDNGADLQTRVSWRGDRTGWWLIGEKATLLHYAAEDGVPETIKLLIDHGVDIFAAADWNGNDQHDLTALDVAAIYGDAENAIAILEHPRFQHSNLEFRKRLLNRCLVTGAAPVETYQQLMYGHKSDRVRLLEALLKQGADPNAKEAGHTAIEAAAEDMYPTNKENEHRKNEVALLVKHGATLDFLSAVEVGDEEQVTRHLKRNPSAVNAVSRKGLPALHLAVMMNYPRIVERFLQCGANVRLTNRAEKVAEIGDTPLHLAASFGSLEIARLLIARGADVNASTQQNLTPLHDAVAARDEEMVRLLLENGAKADVKTSSGKTPLDLARGDKQDDFAEIAAIFNEFANKRAK